MLLGGNIMTKQNDLNTPRGRAEHIARLPLSMKLEVLSQFENMAIGLNGGFLDSFDSKTVRDTYYKDKSDAWFKQVLAEHTRLTTK
jgi:hypothetical protein